MRFTANSAAILLAGALCSAASAQTRTPPLAAEPLFECFDKNDDGPRWWRADNRVGAKKINDTGFSADNIAIGGGEMALRLTGEAYRDRANTGASFKSRELFGYGRYDAVMKAARGEGVVSAFYTYTGPVFGAPHDEIDFEFLGKDPHLLHLNYFVGGEAKLKKTVALDFDASANFHHYAIEWRPGEIVWIVDGEVLHRETGDVADMPQHPGKIIAEIWAAKGLKKWAGELDRAALPSEALVRCLSYRPHGEDAPQCRLEEDDASSRKGAP